MDLTKTDGVHSRGDLTIFLGYRKELPCDLK